MTTRPAGRGSFEVQASGVCPASGGVQFMTTPCIAPPLLPPKKTAPSLDALRSLLMPAAPQPDPAESLTKYLLALNETLASLLLDSQDFERNPISIWEERKAAHVACFKARLAVYEEIVRVVADGTVAPTVTNIVDKDDEPKSNNAPVGYPVSDAAIEKESGAHGGL